mgnify:FL=1|jgi:hypothetical protein
MITLETLEKDLRVELRTYKSKRTMIDEVIPHDLDELYEIVKENPKMFSWLIRDIRNKIQLELEEKIALR